MATTWKAPTWRMPNDKNQSKFESYSVNFNGTDEYIDSNDTFSALDGLTTISLSVWIKPTDLSNFRHIFSIPKGTGNNNNIVRLTIRNTGVLWWTFGSDSYRGTEASQSLILNEWNHVVGIFDTTQAASSNRVKIFVNNTQSSLPDLTMPQNTTAGTATGGVFIGENGSNLSYLSSFKGEMSQVSIFNYAISNAQVSSLYNSGSPINPMTLKPAPIANYLLGGDSSTGGDSTNTLSVPNIAVPDASVFNFDTSDFITTKTISEFGITGEFSVSMWLNSTTLNGYATPLWASDGSFTSGFGFFYNSSRFHFFVDHYITYGVVQTGTSTTNVWYHLVGTFSSSGTVKLYINGEANGTPKTGATLDGLNNTLTISKGTAVAGDITNVQLWDKELLDSEVSTLYNSGVPLLTGTQPQAANLKAWYKLDQSANWEAVTANTWQIPDNRSAYPQSFELDGTTDCLFSFSPTTLNTTEAYTISAWVNLDTTSNITIISGNAPGGSNYFTVPFGIRSVSGSFAALVSYQENGANVYRVGNNIAKSELTNGWHHVMLVKDGVDCTFYYDGQPNGTASFNTTPPATINLTTIGRGFNNFMFNGKLSNVQVWQDGLTATDAQTLYNNGVPLTTAIASNNLKAWYKLDNTEYFNNEGKWIVDNDAITPFYNNALNFTNQSNGSGNSIEIFSGTPASLPSNLSFGASDSFSFSTWLWSETKKTSTNMAFVMRGASGSDPYNRLDCFYLSSNNSVRLTMSLRSDNTATASVQTTASVPGQPESGAWFNVVVVVDRTAQTLQMFVNAEGTNTASISSLDGFLDLSDITIGNDPYNNGRYYYGGRQSNFAIFNKALTQGEIETLYNNGTPEENISHSPVSWWKLNNLSTGLVDSAGGGNDATAGSWMTVVESSVNANISVSSGMTEQNLVNNNVSVLNGESSGMDTSNLVTSTLTRQVPYNSYSLSFNAVNDFINCGNSSIFDITSTITVSAWIKASSSGWIASFPFFVTKGTNVSYMLFGRQVSSTSLLPRLRIGVNGDPNMVEATTSVNSTDWHHILGTFDGSTMKIYVNGKLDNSKSLSQSIPTGTDDLTIGGVSGGGTSGLISNVSIFDEELTSTEVMKLYNSGVPSDLSSFHPSPTAWWSLGSDSYYNGTNYICPDLIGTNNGTSSGMGANALVGNAPKSTANGTSTNMTIGENLTGSAPNSSNNSFSVNMSFDDRETNVPS